MSKVNEVVSPLLKSLEHVPDLQLQVYLLNYIFILFSVNLGYGYHLPVFPLICFHCMGLVS